MTEHFEPLEKSERPERTAKSVSFESMIKIFLRTYNIPTRRDVDRLLKRMDQIENLIKALAAVQHSEEPPLKKQRKRDPLVKPGSTASKMVLEVILKYPEGINFDHIHKETGFDPRKIRNIVYRLARAGSVQNIGRGVYAPV